MTARAALSRLPILLLIVAGASTLSLPACGDSAGDDGSGGGGAGDGDGDGDGDDTSAEGICEIVCECECDREDCEDEAGPAVARIEADGCEDQLKDFVQCLADEGECDGDRFKSDCEGYVQNLRDCMDDYVIPEKNGDKPLELSESKNGE